MGTHPPAAALRAATALIDAISMFSPTASESENRRALDRALCGGISPCSTMSSREDIASAAVICMQWLAYRVAEHAGRSREEVLWSLREFLEALGQGGEDEVAT